MSTLYLQKSPFELNEFSYDPLADRVYITYSTKDPKGFKEALLEKEALSDFHIDDNIFDGYSKVTAFIATYDSQYDIFNCFVTLERDESQFQKLVSRIEKLESTKDELTAIKDDISALQKVNLAALVKDKLIADEKAAVLADTISSVSEGQISMSDIKIGGLS